MSFVINPQNKQDNNLLHILGALKEIYCYCESQEGFCSGYWLKAHENIWAAVETIQGYTHTENIKK